MNLVMHSDPGHGWLAAPRSLLSHLGILSMISPYSYQRGGTVYLEEDCDAALLLRALRDEGEPVTIIERHTDRRSPIRGYARYTPDGPRMHSTGDVLLIGGARYRLIQPCARGAWLAHREPDGKLFRIPATMAQSAEAEARHA